MSGPREIGDFDVALFDLDGTVYYGDEMIPGANDSISLLRGAGVRVFFATNNSTKTRAQIHDRLVRMGIDCRLDEVLTSGLLAARYALHQRLGNVFVFGSESLVAELEAEGVSVAGEDEAENLLIGYDPGMTYAGLSSAVRVAMRARQIIACNRERVYPGKDAVLLPGCGAMTAPVEWCSGRECDVVVGKPSPLMVEQVARELDVNVRRTLVIGDTYESDVRMAFRAGAQALLVGTASRRDVVCIPSVGHLADAVRLGAVPSDLRYRELREIDEVRRAWDALGATQYVPLGDQVADIDSYVRKVAANGRTIACVGGDEVVGAISFYANDGAARRAFVTHLAVTPKCRRRGIGRSLVRLASERSREGGMEHLSMDVARQSKPALRLMQSLGFTPEDDKGETMRFERRI